MDKKSDKNRTVPKLIFTVFLILAITAACYFIMKALGLTELTKEELQEYINSKGAVAPIIYIVISFAQIILVPIPGMITILAGNYVFGPGLAFLYSYIGMLIGAMSAFALGKLIGRPFVNWIAGSKEKVDDWLKRLKGRENVLLFFMFLLPFFPDDILCAIAGILPISALGFFIMQIITRATSIGATLLLMSGEIIPYRGWGLVVLAIIGIVCVLTFIYSFRNAEKINDFFAKTVDKIFRKHGDNNKSD